MADLKISELSALAGANLVAADELAIVDDSASETKKITVSDLIANGVTVISDDTIPGAKILFAAGDIATAALADSAVTTAKVADDAVTAAKLANESTVDLVTTLPASGAFTGQLALDTDDNSLYAWDGSAWQSLKAPGSINTVSGSTTGEVNIVATTSGSTVTVSATLDDTTAAAQFLAGPTGAAGTVGYRAISGTDLPTATTTAKGGVIVNGNGLTMDSDTIEIDNTVTASSTHHVVTYNAQGLITGGRAITSADLPIATSSAVGGVIAGSGLAVDVSGNLSIDNTVTSGTYTKVTVSAQGVVTAGTTLVADDIPDHSAAKLTSGTIGTSLIANDAITAAKMADQSTVLFGGALGSDNVTIFPAGDYKGQMFWDETSEDLYIYTGSAFIPITVLSGNLVNAGSYNANTNLMSSVTTAGSSAGFSAGSALPAPAATNLNHYVVVDTSGTGSGAAPAVALAPPDMLLSQGVGTEYALIDVSNAIAGQTASNISVIASGNIAATDVQAALQELDTEKLQKAGDTMTGALGIGTASSIVFEGSSADDYETTLTVTDPTADRTITLPNITGTVVTTGDTGSVTSTMILDGTIANADISSTAEIAVSKLANGTARQLLQTDSAGTGVEFTSNVDVPGTLDVTGAGTFDSTVGVAGLLSADGKLNYPAGTAAAPSLYSGSDTDTGIYSPGSDQFGITTGGTAAVTVDSSQRVGIGVTSPNYELHVHDASGSSTIQLTNGTVGSASTDGARITGSTNGILYFENLENAATVFTTNNTERVRIDGSGNVGVGLTSPQTRLHCSGTTNGAQATFGASSSGLKISTFQKTDNDAGVILDAQQASNGTLTFATGGTEAARIDSSGTLTVGPQYDRLNVNPGSGSYDGDPTSVVIDGRTNDGSTTAFKIDRYDGSGSASTKVFINYAGQVGIGTSSPSVELSIAGNDPQLCLWEGTDGASSSKVQLGTGTAQGFINIHKGDGTRTVQINSDGTSYLNGGNVGVGTTAPRRQFHIHNSASATVGMMLTNGNTGEANDSQGFQLKVGSDSHVEISQMENSHIGIFTNASERMRIDSSGDVELMQGKNLTWVFDGGSTHRARIRAESSDDLIFENGSGNSERMRLDSSGRLLINHTADTAPSSFESKLQLCDTSYQGSSLLLRRDENNSSCSHLLFAKSRSGSKGGGTVVQNGDLCGRILWYAADGTDTNNQVASIEAIIDGTPGTDDTPGRLVFSTTADGARSATERFKITSAGKLRAPGVYSLTTTGGGPVYVESDGDLLRYTSSLKYKTDVETIEDVRADAILNCRPVWYRSKCENDIKTEGSEKSDWGWYGFIAEEVAEVEPRLVSWATKDAVTQEDGSVETVERDPADYEAEGVRYDNFVPLLVNLVKRQQQAIETLEAKVAALEAA